MVGRKGPAGPIRETCLRGRGAARDAARPGAGVRPAAGGSCRWSLEQVGARLCTVSGGCPVGLAGRRACAGALPGGGRLLLCPRACPGRPRVGSWQACPDD